MRCEFLGSIHRTWKSSPLGAPTYASKVLPPSTDRYSDVCATYSTSGWLGSANTRLKYSLPRMRGSLVDCRQVAPPSSERKKPWSMMAYKRRAPVPGATAMPILLRAFSGSPLVISGLQIEPSSLDLMTSDVASTLD